MDDLDNGTDTLEDPQESYELSDGCDDFSFGAGGTGSKLKYGVGDEGREAIRRMSELCARFQEIELPAIAGILEANKQVQAIARSFAQSDSVRQLLGLQKSLLAPDVGKALALSQGVRCSADATSISLVEKTLDQAFSNATFQSIGALNAAVNANLAQVTGAMSRYGRGLVDFDQFGAAASTALAPMLDSLRRMDFEFDWDGALRLHETWGKLRVGRCRQHAGNGPQRIAFDMARSE